MIYEDPRVLPKASADYTEKIIKNLDEEEVFLGGRHHPWRRFFARIVEVVITASTVLFLLTFFLAAIIPRQLDELILMSEDPVISSVVVYLALIHFEAAMLSFFGTTPAKWLFGIRVLNAAGKPLSFSKALYREFIIFVNGLFFGIPFVNLLPQFFAYLRLIRTGTTLWDKSTEAVVTHKKWGVVRALFCTAAVLFSMILTSALIAAEA